MRTLYARTRPGRGSSPAPALAAFALAACALAAAGVRAQDGERMNIVLFLIDDLGYRDVGAYNPDTFYETPNIDALARGGMRFTDGYAASPVCSPTRYSIMTGRYPSRVDATDWFTGRRVERFAPAPLRDRMPLEEVTVAEALRSAGYATFFAGKWHLGPDEAWWPEAQGFDVNVGGHHRGSPPGPGRYFAPWDNPRLDAGAPGEFLTDRLAAETADFVRSRAGGPFFAVMSLYSVHIPLMAPADLVAKYEAKARAEAAAGTAGPEFLEEEQVWPTDAPRRVRVVQSHPVYAAMVEAMDRAVGRVLDAIDETGQAERTAVFFVSDNGGLSTAEGLPTSNLPLRGGKGWLYEGGIRVPFVARVPGVTAPGSVSSAPALTTDLYPTILELAGLPARPAQHLDGVSLLPALRGGPLPERALLLALSPLLQSGRLPRRRHPARPVEAAGAFRGRARSAPRPRRRPRRAGRPCGTRACACSRPARSAARVVSGGRRQVPRCEGRRFGPLDAVVAPGSRPAATTGRGLHAAAYTPPAPRENAVPHGRSRLAGSPSRLAADLAQRARRGPRPLPRCVRRRAGLPEWTDAGPVAVTTPIETVRPMEPPGAVRAPERACGCRFRPGRVC